MKRLLALLLIVLAGCHWDPITPAHSPRAPRPNPYLPPTNEPPRVMVPGAGLPRE